MFVSKIPNSSNLSMPINTYSTSMWIIISSSCGYGSGTLSGGSGGNIDGDVDSGLTNILMLITGKTWEKIKEILIYCFNLY